MDSFALLVKVQFYFDVYIYIATYINNHGNTICNEKDKRKHPMAVSAEDWLKIMV